MRIVIGSDHAGFPLKEDVTAYLRQLGNQVVDVGTHGTDPVDYSDYARGHVQSVTCRWEVPLFGGYT
mgnify:CR=1 FL=1